MHNMAKTIAVSDETYELLKRLKGENESFSELITKSLKKRSSLMSIAGSGTLSTADWKKTRKELKKGEMITEKKLLDAGRSLGTS